MNTISKKNSEKARAVSHCLKGIANESRICILMALADKEKGVCELADILGCAQPKISQHLSKMKDRGIVTSRREGNQIFYAIADRRVFQFLDLMKELFCK